MSGRCNSNFSLTGRFLLNTNNTTRVVWHVEFCLKVREILRSVCWLCVTIITIIAWTVLASWLTFYMLLCCNAQFIILTDKHRLKVLEDGVKRWNSPYNVPWKHRMGVEVQLYCLNPAAWWEWVICAMCWLLYSQPLLEAWWAPGLVWTGFVKSNTPCPPPGIESQTIQPNYVDCAHLALRIVC
jgi:hypothetical protein